MEVYEIVGDYKKCYNERRKHGSIKNMSPVQFYEASRSNSIKTEAFIA